MPENKFKAGDRLVAIETYGGVTSGEFVVVDRTATPTTSCAWVHLVGKRQHYSFDGSFKESQFKLWQPKVGDRVRAKDRGWEDSARGIFIRKVDGNYLVEFADGWCRGHDSDLGDDKENRWWHTLNELEPLPVAAEARAAAALKIEAGRYYRDADGKKVGPMRTSVNWPTTHPFFEQGELGRWSESGEPCIDSTLRRRAKLIAEWVEPAKPVVAATVDYQADEYGSGVKAEPRFKVGDFVTARSPFGSERRGRITEVDHTDNWLTYRLDDRGTWVTADSVQLVANDNAPVAEQPAPADDERPKFKKGDRVRLINDEYLSGYGLQVGDVGTVDENNSMCPFVMWDKLDDAWCDVQANFELAQANFELASSNPTAIVARIDNGQPRPNPTPFVHHSQEAAAKEAARLANLHKGHKFGVYVLTGEPVLVEPKVKVGDVVTLTAPVRVTGFTGGKANIVTADGGSFVLPVSALAAA